MIIIIVSLVLLCLETEFKRHYQITPFRHTVIPLQFISRTVACIEMQVGIKLEINKRKSSTEPEFEKRALISSNRGLRD